MSIIDKIFKKKDKKEPTKNNSYVNRSEAYRKAQSLNEGELGEDDLENVTACTPRENMIHNFPKKDSRKDDGR